MLHTYVDPLSDDEQPTTKFLQQNFDALNDLGILVVDVQCHRDDRFAYYEAVKQNWKGDAKLILLERDIVPTMQQLNKLLECPNSNCAYVYITRAGRLSCRMIHPYTHEVVPVPARYAFAQYVGFGFTKMNAEFRRSHPLPHRPVDWLTFDTEYCEYALKIDANTTWCVHWPEVVHIPTIDLRHRVLIS